MPCAAPPQVCVLHTGPHAAAAEEGRRVRVCGGTPLWRGWHRFGGQGERGTERGVTVGVVMTTRYARGRLCQRRLCQPALLCSRFIIVRYPFDSSDFDHVVTARLKGGDPPVHHQDRSHPTPLVPHRNGVYC